MWEVRRLQVGQKFLKNAKLTEALLWWKNQCLVHHLTVYCCTVCWQMDIPNIQHPWQMSLQFFNIKNQSNAWVLLIVSSLKARSYFSKVFLTLLPNLKQNWMNTCRSWTCLFSQWVEIVEGTKQPYVTRSCKWFQLFSLPWHSWWGLY